MVYKRIGGHGTNQSRGWPKPLRPRSSATPRIGDALPLSLPPPSFPALPAIRSAERRPTASSWPIPVDAYLLIQEGDDPDPAHVYWARYENAQGKVWETRNPGDRSARWDIRRVRAVRLHERLEEHRRIKARKRGLDWERKALAELPQVPEGAHEGQ